MNATRGEKIPVTLWGSALAYSYPGSEDFPLCPPSSSRQPPRRRLPTRVYFILIYIYRFSFRLTTTARFDSKCLYYYGNLSYSKFC